LVLRVQQVLCPHFLLAPLDARLVALGQAHKMMRWRRHGIHRHRLAGHGLVATLAPVVYICQFLLGSFGCHHFVSPRRCTRTIVDRALLMWLSASQSWS